KYLCGVGCGPVPVARRELRAAPQAGAKTRLFCLCSELKEAAVFQSGGSHPANRPAVDARGCHAHKEAAVEPRIFGAKRSVAGRVLGGRRGLHVAMVRFSLTADWPFPDV